MPAWQLGLEQAASTTANDAMAKVFLLREASESAKMLARKPDVSAPVTDN
jgi:hypothetical protein